MHMLGKDVPKSHSKKKNTDELSEEGLAYLKQRYAEILCWMFLNSGTIEESIYDLRPTDVPVEHSFDLKSDEPIYCKGRRDS